MTDILSPGATIGILAVFDPTLAARLDAWRDALSASIPDEPSDD